MAVKEGRSHSLEQILGLGIPSPPPAFGLTAQRPQLGEPLLSPPPTPRPQVWHPGVSGVEEGINDLQTRVSRVGVGGGRQGGEGANIYQSTAISQPHG